MYIHEARSSSSRNGYTDQTAFYPEWKNAIISINPKSILTTYKWIGDTLKVETLYN